MARARNIKPGFLKNEELLEIEPLGRLLFAGLWMLADREGRLEDRPKRIKLEILPGDNCDVDELLWQLNDRGLVHRYKVGDTRYLCIPNFLKHQNPHPKESKSVIPDLSDGYMISRLGEIKVPPTSDLGVDEPGLFSESLNPESNTPQTPQGGLAVVATPRRKPKRQIAAIEKALGVVRLRWWDDFWGIFPCHDDKRSAMDAFERTVVSEEIWAKVRAGAVRYRAKADGDPEMKLKFGQGWINGERWEDENTRARASPNVGKTKSDQFWEQLEAKHEQADDKDLPR